VALCSVAFAAVVGVGVAMPAYAQAMSASGAAPTVAVQSQSLTVSAEVPSPLVGRDSYGVTSPPTMVWPVNPASRIASPFGPRSAPCAGCSSVHEGVDFDAGNGAVIHAIAAGVVVETNSPGWTALGVHVAIEHVIDGKTVVSAYGHMQVGSMPLKVGDTVYAGEPIGLVGSTGESTGPHLHFEIRLNGTTPTDPLPWLHAHLG
jgi:murein DD-endopeptidase MepM/ murein hydrolase activator NlpD